MSTLVPALAPGGGPSEWPVRASDKAVGAWRNVGARIGWSDADRLGRLEPVGERVGRLVLLDRTGTPPRLDAEQTRRLGRMLAPLGYAAVEVLSAAELERVGVTR